MAILVVGVTFPSGVMQEQLVSSLYRECGIKPGEVEYVEAHGTGTKVSMAPLGLEYFLVPYFLPLHHLPHFSIKLFFAFSKIIYISPFYELPEYVLLHHFWILPRHLKSFRFLFCGVFWKH